MKLSKIVVVTGLCCVAAFLRLATTGGARTFYKISSLALASAGADGKIRTGNSKATTSPSSASSLISAAMKTASAACSVQLQVAIRNARGDGLRTLIVKLGTEASAQNLTIGKLKEIICKPPHSICADGASSLALVLKGLLLTDDKVQPMIALTSTAEAGQLSASACCHRLLFVPLHA